MHTIEPYYKWREFYSSEKDTASPFYGVQYSEFHFTNHIYNFAIHPQWDDFGSETLLLKVLFVDYEEGYCIIEMIGEWNDAINNDIMLLKRELIDLMIDDGIDKFILIGEHVLNFHSSDDSYYEEWAEDLGGGWVTLINFHPHVLDEMENAGIGNYFLIKEQFEQVDWRLLKPQMMFEKVEMMLPRLLA